MADKRLDQTTNASAVAAADNIPFVTAAGVTSYVTGDELAASGPFSSRYVPLTSDVVWIPAGAFAVTAGSPSIAAYATSVVSWTAVLYDASSAEYAGSNAWLPAHWNTFHIDLYWTNPSSGSGDVVWTTIYRSFGDGDATGVTSGGNDTVTAPAEDVLKVSRLETSISPTRGRPLFFVIGRLASDAADTLGNDAAVIGVALVRAT